MDLRGQLCGGGQPAISPWAFVPQELIHPFVPFDRVVTSFDFGNTASRTDCRSVETEEGTRQFYRSSPDQSQFSEAVDESE